MATKFGLAKAQCWAHPSSSLQPEVVSSAHAVCQYIATSGPLKEIMCCVGGTKLTREKLLRLLPLNEYPIHQELLASTTPSNYPIDCLNDEVISAITALLQVCA